MKYNTFKVLIMSFNMCKIILIISNSIRNSGISNSAEFDETMFYYKLLTPFLAHTKMQTSISAYQYVFPPVAPMGRDCHMLIFYSPGSNTEHACRERENTQSGQCPAGCVSNIGSCRLLPPYIYIQHGERGGNTKRMEQPGARGVKLPARQSIN